MEHGSEGALVVPPKDKAIAVLLNMEPRISEVADINVLYIDNIDSTNMRPEHWDKIATAVHENYTAYDGFVITHGTNTMAYTASALSYALLDLGKPVILTGAQIPGNQIETDARRNFVNAVRVAISELAGVAVVFDEEIIMGARTTKDSESKLDAFETVNWDLWGEIRIDIRLSDEAPRRHNRPCNLQTGFESNIVVIHLVPGIDALLLDKLLESDIKGLVLRGFGPGDIAYDYLPILEKARNKKIPVVVDSQCREGATKMGINDVGAQALKLGAIEVFDMSIESVTTKLMWVLKHTEYENVKILMQKNFVGEINPEGKIY